MLMVLQFLRIAIIIIEIIWVVNASEVMVRKILSYLFFEQEFSSHLLLIFILFVKQRVSFAILSRESFLAEDRLLNLCLSLGDSVGRSLILNKSRFLHLIDDSKIDCLLGEMLKLLPIILLSKMELKIIVILL